MKYVLGLLAAGILVALGWALRYWTLPRCDHCGRVAVEDEERCFDCRGYFCPECLGSHRCRGD